jgi:HEAT repeat protein
MAAAEQLDLFSASAGAAEQLPSGRTTGPVIACNTLDDDNLVAAILNAGLRDCLALAAEAGRRRLHAAIPALEALCQRFTGFGVDRIVPEQAAALDALVMIGCPDAAQTVARLIAKRVVQGPCLRQAAAAAARLGAKLPAGAVMDLLRHHDPQIRADACRFAHPWREAIPLLRDLVDDLHSDVGRAAACALGHMGQSEVRPLLARYLREKPSVEVIDAIASLADEDCVILLGRVARAVPDLSGAVLNALDAIDHPRAEKIADAIREKLPT